MRKRYRLGISLGDINGVGPEIALKAAEREWPRDLQLVLIGPGRALRTQAEELACELPPRIESIDEEIDLPVLAWDPDTSRDPDWMPGRLDIGAALAAEAAIRAATQACLSGVLDGMVTAPISKEGFKKAGLDIPGHTEFIAGLCQTSRFAMLLSGGGLRVVLATRHLSLREVSEKLLQQSIEEAIELAAEGLPWLGADSARIGVCGLNPHAGDGGALGDEEHRLITPAIEAARRKGIEVDDVVPADVIFYKALRGKYDAVVAMYHDQGLAPLKMIAFEEGINVTLGLPIVRTSPDHGTAYDIAAGGIANPASIVSAIELANRLARKPNPWASIA